ncbi:ubiquitin-like protein DSK2, putative [Trypanosoma equiperdum]|uniref:Ubiquitin-like protein DSK2, putative n=4 Tax=Trypanozoon TaxID=39700 RepID=Q38BA3_TRYB2|nr:ubiquitin-like protein DSK2, putative [Trypanosoma brucei gambiense DAL972]XP_822745.1 ubiquitin-like protein DSK2, putative [Trypanosoma brucei brucei TREU927]RHW69882.1 ubiquitin-like protein DSK2 [Trypanosoma brucei equiperdum]SCU65136.1 ubiquitin-like protein DSK2, putative [Trypanosoma equiperdum]EAN77917.1 ubiquitin-like protein DSK2, putative [Trypanosoma brucei brucei TREU927]CBH15518.1 ubiquitin-like protein DSK2, putative [Trypanosoma brucei gambiense DAL972]|eukprot:XP_011777782.1 ubiquitin-like protein DSK2, putative [Trypanosoma brucei gambiense DAL972]
MSITIKLTNGDKKTVEVPDLSITVIQFKELAENAVEIPAAEQRIVLRGKVLKDTDVLSAVGLEHGQAVHIVRGQQPKTQATSTSAPVPGPSNPPHVASNSYSTASNAPMNSNSESSNPYMPLAGYMPTSLSGGVNAAGMGGSFPPFSSDAAAQLMQSPLFSQMMRDMLGNPQFMQTMMQFAGNQSRGNDAGMQQLLSDPLMMQYVMQLASNPEFLQEMTRMVPGGGPLSAPQTPFFGQPIPNLTGAPQGGGLSQPQGDPRVVYQSQLQQLRDMGFPNEEANIAALQQTQGNIHFAIERLLNG